MLPVEKTCVTDSFLFFYSLTPSYAIVLGVTATWLNYVGEGPLWNVSYVNVFNTVAIHMVKGDFQNHGFYHQIIMFLVPSDDRVKRLQAILVETSALHKQLLQQIAVHATDMVIILQPIFPSFFRLINTIIRIDHQLITTTTPQCNYHHLSIWYRRQLQIISLHSHLLGVWHMACRAVSL